MNGFWRLYDLEKDPTMCKVGIYELIPKDGCVQLWKVDAQIIKNFAIPFSKLYDCDSIRVGIDILIEASEKIIGINRKPFEGEIEFDVFI